MFSKSQSTLRNEVNVWNARSPLYKNTLVGAKLGFFYFKVLRTGQLLVSKVAQKRNPLGVHILTKLNPSSLNSCCALKQTAA